MPRIRTVKPEFFRHEALQDLENQYPQNKPMLVFCGLWGHCDSAGRFPWRPRQLKLDILPFINFDMGETLSILARAGMVKRYEASGQTYGIIETFREHQRLSGKEAQDGVKYPGSSGENLGSTWEAVNVQEGKGREEEGKKEPLPSEEAKNGIGANGHDGRRSGQLAAPRNDCSENFAPLTPAELQREYFRTGIAYLAKHGKNEKQSRTLLGQWARDLGGIGGAMQILSQSEIIASPDPIAYMQGACEKQKNNRNAERGNGHHLKNGNGHTPAGHAYGSEAWWRQVSQMSHFLSDEEYKKYEAKYGSVQ
jgi:hypothetical protein